MMGGLPRRLSVRLALVSGMQLLLLGSALGLLGYATGRREGLERLSIERQRHQVTSLSEALSERLRAPQTINRSNLLAIEQGQLRLNDFDQLAQQFWRQMQLYPVGYINYGSRSGSFIGVERLDDGQLVLNEDSARPLGRGRLGVYALSSRGRRGALLEVVPGMETFHHEAWYADTVKANRPSWSRIYQWEDKPHVLAISYNAPVRDADGDLLGVIGVDFVLRQLSAWLHQLWRGQSGMALIVEPDGLLVASSRAEMSLVQPGSKGQRMRLDRLKDPIAGAAARTFFVPTAKGTALRLHQAKVSPKHKNDAHTITVGQRSYSLEAWPWGRAEGLNWLLITALSPDEALAQSEAQSSAALVLGVLALVGAVLLNRQLIGWLLAPMQRLQQQANAQLATPEAQFNPGLPQGAASELVTMADAFATLVKQLQQSQRELADKDAQALELLKLKLRSSLEASAVAHEIKGPLSQILLSTRLLQDNNSNAPNLAPQQQLQLSTLAAAAEQVVTTIEKMRTLLRNVQTDHEPLNLAHVTRSALLYLKPSFSKARVALSTRGLASSCTVLGDSAQLQIAIVNVLRNSVEALQAQAGERQITVRLESHDGQVLLQIADNGPGFPPLDNLLEPLQSSRPDGSGLGLFVVQTTLEHHHGTVTLGRSDLGGALVELALPAPPPEVLPNSG